MAKVEFERGAESNLPTRGMAEDGHVYVSSDNGNMYVGNSRGALVPINRCPYYGVCATASTTNAKVVALSDTENFVLRTGVSIVVRFGYSNSVSAPTLNVNGTGAIAVKAYGIATPSLNWREGEAVPFVYDGSYWMCLSHMVKEVTVNEAYQPLSLNPVANSVIHTELVRANWRNHEAIGDIDGLPLPKQNGYISTTSPYNWFTNQNQRFVAYPLNHIKHVKVTANNSNGARFAFLTSVNVGNNVAVAFASGTSLIQINTVGASAERDVPSDAKFLYIALGSATNQERKPKSLLLTGDAGAENYPLTFGSDTYDGSEPKEITAASLGALTQHQDISGKADKVASPASGNFAGLDANGNITDSGYSPSDFLQSQEQADWEETDASDPSYIKGKPDLSAFITVDDVADELDVTSEVTASGNQRYGCINMDTGQSQYKWSNNQITTHVILPVPSNTVCIRVTASNHFDAFVAFLTADDSANGVTNGATPSYAGNTQELETVTKKSTETLAVPQGARYLYVYTYSFDNLSYTPDSVKLVILRSSDTSGLAIDAEVVHKTGDETVSGDKTFTDDVSFQNCIVFPKGGQNDEDVMIFNGTMGANDHVGVLALESESGAVAVRGVAEPVQSNDAANKDYVDGKTGNSKLFYGTCSTSAATETKSVTCNEFTSEDLVNGAMVLVKFSTTNNAAVGSLKLNVNMTGAYPIKKIYAMNGISNITYKNELYAGSVIPFIFTGAYWMVAGLDYNNTYSAMTNANLVAGVETSGRLISAAQIKTYLVHRENALVKESFVIETASQTEHPVAIAVENCYNGGGANDPDVAVLSFEDNANLGNALVILRNLHDPVQSGDAATKSYVDAKDGNAVHKTGNEEIEGEKTFKDGVFLDSDSQDKHCISINTSTKTSDNTGVVVISDEDESSDAVLRGVAKPVVNTDAANKLYADERGDGLTLYDGVAGFNGLHNNSLCALDYQGRMSSFTPTGGDGIKTVDTNFDHFFHLPIPTVMIFTGNTVAAGASYQNRAFRNRGIVDVRNISLRGSNLPNNWANLGDPVYLSFCGLVSNDTNNMIGIKPYIVPDAVPDDTDLWSFPSVPRDIIISKKMMDDAKTVYVGETGGEQCYEDAYQTMFTTIDTVSYGVLPLCGYIYLGRMVGVYDLMLEDNNPAYSYHSGYFLDYSIQLQKYMEQRIMEVIRQYHPT